MCEKVSLEWVKQQAEKELESEYRRKLIDEEKVRILTKRPFLHKIFPFTIKITRR